MENISGIEKIKDVSFLDDNKIFFLKYKGKHGDFTVIPSRLTINEDLAYFYGLQGDRDGRSGVVGISNTDIGVLEKYHYLLRNLLMQPLERIHVLFQVKRCLDLEFRERLFGKIYCKKENIHIDTNDKQKGELSVRLYVKNIPLKRLLDEFELKLKKELLHLNNKIKLRYIAGRFDAEGSVDTLLNQFRIRSYSRGDLEFDAKLLRSLGYNPKIIPNSKNRFDGWHLILGYTNYEEFLDFASTIYSLVYHSKKKDLIEKIINGKFSSKREKEFLEVLEDGGLKVSELAREFGISTFTCYLILRNLLRNRLIVRNKQGRAYVYYLVRNIPNLQLRKRYEKSLYEVENPVTMSRIA